MPKLCIWRVISGADKVLDPVLKLATQTRRHGIPKPIPELPKSMPQPQRRITPVLPRKGQGRAGVRRKITGPRLQPIPIPQPKHLSPPVVP